MKRVSRVTPLGVFSFTLLVGFSGAAASAATTITVASHGAKCNAVTDDRAAIQSTLNAAAAAGGGTVTLPGSTCLLNSFAPSSHPWQFYNLHIPSNVTLQGVAGSKLLQGPGGRQSLGNVPGAAWVINTVVAVSNDYATIQFQNGGNGGFYNLNAMTVGSPSVTLSTAAQAANFGIGDYVAIYEYTSGDVLPAHMTEITGVNVASGQLTLADPVIRPFAAPSIANVTSLAAHDVAINDVIVQGADPLAVTETFKFSARNNKFLADTSIGGGNVSELEMSTVDVTNGTYPPSDPTCASYTLGHTSSPHDRWCFGRRVVPGGDLSSWSMSGTHGNSNPLNFMSWGDTGGQICAANQNLDNSNLCTTGGENYAYGYYLIVRGTMQDLGYPIGPTNQVAFKWLLHAITDPAVNPWTLGEYLLPVQYSSPANHYVQTWTEYMNGFGTAQTCGNGDTSGKIVNWQTISAWLIVGNTGQTCNGSSTGDTDYTNPGYPHIMKGAAAYLVDLNITDSGLSGTTAWNWMASHVNQGTSTAGIGAGPQFTIVPRNLSTTPVQTPFNGQFSVTGNVHIN